MTTKAKATEYEPVAPPEGWKAGDPFVIVKRPLFSSTAARTFGRFLLFSAAALAVEFLLYMGFAAMASSDRIVGVETRTVEVQIHGSANPFAFYPALLIGLCAVYVIAAVVWFINRDY